MQCFIGRQGRGSNQARCACLWAYACTLWECQQVTGSSAFPRDLRFPRLSAFCPSIALLLYLKQPDSPTEILTPGPT